MEKHQLITSQITVDRISLVTDRRKLEELVKKDLSISACKCIIDTPNIAVIGHSNEFSRDSEKFELAFVVINPDDYKKLSDAINKYDFKFINEDGHITNLKDLL